MLNAYFVRDIKKFVTKKHSSREVYREFILVFLTGISNVLLFSGTFFIFGVDYSGTILKNDLLNSIYFSVVTWTTLGYGDFQPIESLRLLAAFEAFMGYVYMSVLLGLFLSLIKVEIKPEG